MDLNLKMTLTIGEDDLKEIIKSYLKTNNYELIGEVIFKIDSVSCGYGCDEHLEYKLESASIDVRPITKGE